MNALKTKPITLVAIAHAVLACLIAFGVVELDGSQLAAVEGLFAAVGFGGASLVTANTRLAPEVLAEARERTSPWAAALTDTEATAIGDALRDGLADDEV